MQRFWLWAGSAILLCTSVVSAASVSGATATVAKIDPATATATIQITNVSNQGIDAFVITSNGTFTSGKTEFDEHSKDYGPLYKQYGLLDPGHTTEINIPFTAQANDPLERVDSQVVVVIYADQTAEVTDERAFKHKMDDRQRMANAMQTSATILQRALSNPAESHPAARVLANINDALLAAEDKGQDKGILLSLREAMEHVSGAPVERELVQQYLDIYQKQVPAFVAYTHVRRSQ